VYGRILPKFIFVILKRGLIFAISVFPLSLTHTTSSQALNKTPSPLHRDLRTNYRRCRNGLHRAGDRNAAVLDKREARALPQHHGSLLRACNARKPRCRKPHAPLPAAGSLSTGHL